MKTEIEIKLAVDRADIQSLIGRIEIFFSVRKRPSFHQVTRQFFCDDWTTQSVFPRIRNEEDGRTTLTIKVKTKEHKGFFSRIEHEAEIIDADEIARMMPYFGFTKEAKWEKRRHIFTGTSDDNGPYFFLDETPIGWFLEIEGEDAAIENAVDRLSLQHAPRITKSYLGLWEDYKIRHALPDDAQMLFAD